MPNTYPKTEPRGRFSALASELFGQMGAIRFDRLNERDQRALAAAYLEDNADSVRAALAEVPCKSVASHLANLVSCISADRAIENVDLLDLGRQLWTSIWPSQPLASLVEREFNACQSDWAVSGKHKTSITDSAQGAFS